MISKNVPQAKDVTSSVDFIYVLNKYLFNYKLFFVHCIKLVGPGENQNENISN